MLFEEQHLKWHEYKVRVGVKVDFFYLIIPSVIKTNVSLNIVLRNSMMIKLNTV